MNTIEKLNIGIGGVCGRGADLKKACDAVGGVRIHAVCDLNAADLPDAAQRCGGATPYLQYEDMLESPDLDAVIICTPMPLHASQSVAALERGLHVLSEVTAGVSIEACRDLVVAADAGPGLYMMAENYAYMKPNLMIREMVNRGLFGTPYYAEAEYLHEIRDYAVKTPWRRKWQLGIDGITYGTHSLGPLLQWMPGDRITRVCCEGTGSRHTDSEGRPFCQSSSTMLGKTAREALIKIRVDLLSDRPHAPANYQLQGTDGAYESARAHGENDRVWLRDRGDSANRWEILAALEDEFFPAHWKAHLERAESSGHGGSDYFVVLDFLEAVKGVRPCPIGIHEAMDMTLPGLCSQESIQRHGAWIDVPDSRTWV